MVAVGRLLSPNEKTIIRPPSMLLNKKLFGLEDDILNVSLADDSKWHDEAFT